MSALRYHRAIYLFTFVLLLLTSCAQLMTKPNNLEQTILYTQAGLTTLYQALGDMVIQGKVSASQRDAAIVQLDRGYAALQTAKAAQKYGNLLLAQSNVEKAKVVMENSEELLKSYSKENK